MHTIHQQLQSELSDLYPASEIAAFAQLIQYYITDFNIPTAAISNLQYELIQQLKSHKPIQYILGVSYFWNRYFRVNEYTLIPRPETEELIYWIKETFQNKQPPNNIIDIGTGSGCIAISLQEGVFPNAKVQGMDVQMGAIDIATNNDIENKIEWIQDSILDWKQDEHYKAGYDLIVSNPPYITLHEKADMEKNVLAYEPNIALFVSNNDPLQFYKSILAFADQYLTTDGSVFMELNALFANETAELFSQNGYKTILKKDMQSKWRMLQAIRIK